MSETTAEAKPVLLEREGAVATIRFNRPQQLNAIDDRLDEVTPDEKIVGAWWQGLPIRADALLSVGVTKGGRIVVISVTEGDAPDPCDWTLEQVHPNASRFGIPIQDER